jgi:hypothetical protein
MDLDFNDTERVPNSSEAPVEAVAVAVASLADVRDESILVGSSVDRDLRRIEEMKLCHGF